MASLKLFLFRLFSGLYKKRLFAHDADAPEFVLLKHFLKSKQLHFIDVGANKGEFVYHASQVLPSEKIWAVEPLPYFAKKLRALFGGVTVLNCVLSDAEGYTQFYMPFTGKVPDDSLASVTKPASQKYEIFDVAMRTLDSVTTEKKLSEKTFLKIDVEGHEFAVLSGGSGFISKNADAMLIEIEERHHSERSLSELIQPVTEMGFDCYYFHPSQKKLVAFNDFPTAMQRKEDLNTPLYVNNFWFFAKHLAPQNVVASLNRSLLEQT